MNAAAQRRLTPWLMLGAIALAALLLALLLGVGRGVHWDEPRVRAPLPPAGNPANLPQPLPLQQFALVWQKPLFAPDRKPTASAADGGSQLGDLELTGVILTPALRMALLHDRQADREVRLREGESLPDGSVKLVEVRARSAIFDASGGRTELKLPAGAPIDPPRGADRNASGEGAAPSRSAPPVPPMPNRATPESSRESPAERLRQNIQKRRAARAAAANEGVR
ncbi:general secretion pathway protein GspN [Rhodanobacter sp. FDAARGOS 1247]|uniref:general secretion pathway protein GspN n=1 Tax=Rhodanobacter sp. FDAARGOS 1247 TaxID=2778082 RepID=UPI00195046B6|nr:general secretion pathway protein GspN [Rhodanobacter sp. FDAARGOS 1247]QRP63706.1 general secretion pathway protein GspN [Rhodanobacter sp. FDAARGOS 1247]